MTNYRKGADYERKIVKAAREAGCIAFRSAGSHSPIDVCIIERERKSIRLIQCKKGKYYENTQKGLPNSIKRAIIEEIDKLNDMGRSGWDVHFELL